jgi:hypothetical protein
MNSITQTQAATLQQLCPGTTHQPNSQNNDLKAHLYLEAMQIPLDVQDKILNAIYRLGSVNSNKIELILEQCSLSIVPDRLLH